MPRARFLVLLLGFAIAACDGNKGPTASASIAGTYLLHTINGQSPPLVVEGFTIEGESYTAEITDGSISLTPNGTFSVGLQFRETTGGTVEYTSANEVGQWSQRGTSLTLTYPDGLTDVAVIGDDELTFTFDYGEPVVLVFRK